MPQRHHSNLIGSLAKSAMAVAKPNYVSNDVDDGDDVPDDAVGGWVPFGKEMIRIPGEELAAAMKDANIDFM